jgi:hypothetical protein
MVREADEVRLAVWTQIPPLYASLRPVVDVCSRGSGDCEPMVAESEPIPEGHRVRPLSDGRHMGAVFPPIVGT